MIGTKPLVIRFNEMYIYILEFMIELGIRFNEIGGFIIIYDRTRYLVLFGSEKDAIYNRIRYLISLKSCITHVFSHYFSKIKVVSYDYLPLERMT